MESHSCREIRGRAQYSLGVLYEKGVGVSRDHKEALKWKRMAAEQGEPRAQNHLGVKYAKGEGVEKNYKLAYVWLHLAAVQNNRTARKNISTLTKKMTPEQLTEAKQMAHRTVARKRGQLKFQK